METRQAYPSRYIHKKTRAGQSAALLNQFASPTGRPNTATAVPGHNRTPTQWFPWRSHTAAQCLSATGSPDSTGRQIALPAFSYGYNDWGTLGAFPLKGQLAYGEGLGGDIDATGGQYYPQVPQSAVQNPAQMIAITDRIDDAAHGDSNYAFIYNSDPTRSSLALPETSIPGVVQWAEWPSSIHEGDSNVLFADGHVAPYSQKDLTQINPNQGGSRMNMMWNNDHAVHAPNIGSY